MFDYAYHPWKTNSGVLNFPIISEKFLNYAWVFATNDVMSNGKIYNEVN